MPGVGRYLEAWRPAWRTVWRPVWPVARRLARRARADPLGVVAIGLVAFGIGGMTRYWATAHSLCCDEIFVSINLERRSFAGLTGPLEYGQMAPIGWLWLERVAFLIGGHNELILRFPSLVGGCATLVFLAVVARCLFRKPVALVPVALAAGAPQLIYYSAQVKPYSLEAAATLLLVWLGLRVARTRTRRAIAAFWLAGAVAVWFAATSAFALAGIGLVLAAPALARRGWRELWWHAVMAVPAFVGVLTLYLLQARHMVPWLHGFWSRVPYAFAPHPLTFAGWLSWTGGTFQEFARLALAMTQLPTVAVMIGLGVIALAVQFRYRALIVVAPLLVAYLLALIAYYPFWQRTALWVTPIALLLLGAVAQAAVSLALVAWRHRPVVARGVLTGAAGALTAAVLALLVLANTSAYGHIPVGSFLNRYSGSREGMRYIAAAQRPGDLVFAHIHIGQVPRWYADEVGLRWDGRFSHREANRCRHDPAADRLTHASRVWIVVRRAPWAEVPVPLQVFRAMMRRYGTIVEQRVFGWMVVLLYQPYPKPSAHAEGLPCLLIESKVPPTA